MKYGIANKEGQLSQTAVNQIIQYAVNNDITYIDTAQSYGKSETVLGKAFKKLKQGKKFKVISKLSPAIQHSRDEEIVESVKLSLQKLNIEYLYGFLAHRIDGIYSQNFSSAISRLKEEEQILKGGVSVYTPDEALKALESPIVEILQIPFNILDKRWINMNIFKKAEERNIQLFLRSIFLQGLIFLNEDDLEKKNMSWSIPYIRKFNQMVLETHYSKLELCLGILSHIHGDVVLIMGVDSFNQLENNINILKNLSDFDYVAMEWWEKIPEFPEKLLNPTFWN